MQFWGDASLSVPLVHGNSIHNKQVRSNTVCFTDLIIILQPRNPILGSLARELESSPLKATQLTEQLVDRATLQAMQSGRDIQLVQRIRTPNSKRQVSVVNYPNTKFPLSQVRQLQSRFRKMNLPPDEFEEMFRLSQVLIICGYL